MTTSLTLVAVLALSFAAGGQTPSADAPPPLTCVTWWPDAHYSGAGYDHWVHLQSSCNATAVCSVVTNVNPDAQIAAVEPGEHVAVLTWRGSPAYEFTAWVECR